LQSCVDTRYFSGHEERSTMSVNSITSSSSQSLPQVFVNALAMFFLFTLALIKQCFVTAINLVLFLFVRLLQSLPGKAEKAERDKAPLVPEGLRSDLSSVGVSSAGIRSVGVFRVTGFARDEICSRRSCRAFSGQSRPAVPTSPCTSGLQPLLHAHVSAHCLTDEPLNAPDHGYSLARFCSPQRHPRFRDRPGEALRRCSPSLPCGMGKQGPSSKNSERISYPGGGCQTGSSDSSYRKNLY